jgi:flagellar hook-length control protein FliK
LVEKAMSANLRSVPAGLPANRTGPVSPVDIANLQSNEPGAQDGQDFASWMAQHRELAKTPMGSPAVANRTASPLSKPAQAALPQRALPNGAQSAAPHALEKPKAPTKSADSQANKASASKPVAKGPQSNQGEANADAESTNGPREVKFNTPQGEASAWVQELQPPADLAAGDPAAMLAWLASLTQAEAMPTEAGSPDDATSGGGRTSGAGRATGQDALTGGQQLAAASDAKDALNLAGLADATGGDAQQGKGAKDESGSKAMDFSAIMSREVGRATTAAGSEPARHYTGSLATPVGSPQFAQALSDRVGLWISGPALGGPMTAELRLNPAEMGPVHIRIELDGQNAMVDFSAANAQTREAIEASLPLLSGAMEEVGLSLTGGGVSDQNAGQAWSGSQGEPQATPWARAQDSISSSSLVDSVGVARTEARPAGRPGGLDLYA